MTTDIPSLAGRVSADEWQTRVDLAAAYRLIALYGWSDLVFTHITAKIPGTDNHFLINPYGMFFDEITASSLVKIDLAGNKLDAGNPFPINPAGFVIHSAIHAARDDAKCVLHTHTVNGVAVSAQRAGVLPISQQSMIVLSSLAYHDYEGIALNDEEKPRLVRDMGDKTFLMLRNHGLLTVGASIADAFLSMYIFETTCAIQTRAQGAHEVSGGLIPIPQAVLDGARAQMAQGTRGLGGQLAWPGLLRKLDRVDSSFRH
ncbi:MAG: class II aldolase/adducin family protein [Burkholderiales bacterium]|jgi:ribulose-5-phosphate 4-epimerase/fuculose-1-phosphate aldolase|nr:class II aldolase/adducin family protein [Nitrosomonadaceae bacterium]